MSAHLPECSENAQQAETRNEFKTALERQY